MTESDWNSCSDPAAMFDWVRNCGKLSERKDYLFNAACCRRAWRLLRDERSRRAVEVLERYADGEADWEEVWAANEAAYAVCDTASGQAQRDAAWAVFWATSVPYEDNLKQPSADAANAVSRRGKAPRAAERAVQAALLRCTYWNPFKPAPDLAPSLLTPSVLALAQEAYDNRSLPAGTLDPARLTVLADALEEAGCDDQGVLGHFREQEGVHLRGCWVLDLILDRS